MNITHIVRILESYIKVSKITDKITAIIKALIVIKAQAFTTMRAIRETSIPYATDIKFQLFNYTRSRLRYTMNGRAK